MVGEYVAKPDRVHAMLWDGENYEAAKELLGDRLLQQSGDNLVVLCERWSDNVELAKPGQMLVVNVKSKEQHVQVMDVADFEREYESV
jgi:hypothetical protein